MKIILLERIANLGDLGGIVEVSDGYARNYLIPKGKAKRATADNIKDVEAKRSIYEQKQKDLIDNAKLRSEKLNGQTFAIVAKAGVDGKLFGSVSIIDIVEVVNKSGVTKIEKSEVKLPNGPIKSIGEFEIDISLPHEIGAKIIIQVSAEAA